MKTITIASIAIILSLALAGVAVALPADELQRRIDGLQARIDTAIESGAITHAIARDLNFKLESVRKRFKRVSGTAAMNIEYRELVKRLAIIETETPLTPDVRGQQTPEDIIKSRIEASRKSIDQGRLSGTIVTFEVRALNSELNAIVKDFDAVCRDLPLSPQEVSRLNSKLNRLSARIEKYKTNRVQR